MMSNKTYDTLKTIALLVLPTGTLISAFCNIWNIPYGDQIMQTFAALDVFCGAVVTIAKARYDAQNGGK